VLIAQLSDLHVGGARFRADLLQRAVEEINESRPDLVVIAGDLSDDGYPDQLGEAARALERLEAERRVVVPGNHDARNVGYRWFEDAFGPREGCVRATIGGIDTALVALDTSKPDVDEGEVGREHYGWIQEGLDPAAGVRVFVCHHHLVPIPATGREANQVRDAGDVLALLARSRVDLVLAGHRHVPWAWPLAGMLLVHSGTASTYRTRGFPHPAYNLVTVDAERIEVELRVPGGERRRLGAFPRAWPAELSAPAGDELLLGGGGR
jgi:3',5'-cyclic AMP phosphodiesterase CpdA